MATENFIPDDEIKPSYQDYKWANRAVDDTDVRIPGTAFSDLASDTNEISIGISVILKLIEFNMLQVEGDQKPLFSAFESGALIRLAIRSADLLSAKTEETMEWAYRFHTAEGRKEYSSRK